MLLDWIYRRVKADEKGVEHAIARCYMVRRCENPGMEEGLCAGLRTIDGEENPVKPVKKCRFTVPI